MEVVLLVLRLSLSAVFGTAGLAKLFDQAGSEQALRDFGVPASLVRPMLVILPAAELLIAGSLLFNSSSWYGAVGASVLLLVFIAGMLYQLAKGNSPDCHCFGQIHNEPVGKASVVRNIVLLALSGYLVFSGPSVQGISLINSEKDILPFVLGLTVIILLAGALFLLMRISEQQSQIMRRLEILELVGNDGSQVEREDLGHPHEGLPIGAQFPDFQLPGLDGKPVSLADVRAENMPVLFLFISPTCTPCKSMVAEFKEWITVLDGKVRLVFVSNGKKRDNEDKFGLIPINNILLQKDRELAELVKAKWTPTAVFMDASGRIASHIAAGDAAMRTLVDQVMTADLNQEFTYFTNGSADTHKIKIGRDIPQFTLQDISGNEINADAFTGEDTLVTFWSLTCPHCLEMMKDLREWDKAKGEDDPRLIVFSDGDKAEHEKFELTSPIVLEHGYKTAGKFGMFGTPSAVLVNRNGKIVSETAIGAAEIWSLIGKRK